VTAADSAHGSNEDDTKACLGFLVYLLAGRYHPTADNLSQTWKTQTVEDQDDSEIQLAGRKVSGVTIPMNIAALEGILAVHRKQMQPTGPTIRMKKRFWGGDQKGAGGECKAGQQKR
jgi:hypothetical protein